MSPESPHEASQYHIFNHCLARILLSRLDVVNNSQDPNTSQDHTGQESDLDDFSSYLSSESWPSLPPSLQTATYESRDAVPDPDVLPLDSIPPSFFDTMAAYGITSDTDESMSFIRHVLRDFVQEACAPPPVWSSTRTTECEICEREVPLTYHHLIPRSTHEKARKRKWHPESMLDSVAWLCRPCHTTVHHVARNDDLAQNYYTIDLLLQREDIRRWRNYASRKRFGVRRG
ncbi:hypothetical protein AX14_013426 [Amanita brunnescens Koide BX004]|nr:hypothetical protein AX14_013426 [Amanita brunnescens Koide BX004]